MRCFKLAGIILPFILIFGLLATATDKKMGVADLRQITFHDPVRIGSNLLKPGDYSVRHTMEGEDHVMVFTLVTAKEGVKVKCHLVPLPKKADQSHAIYETNAGQEKVLRELIFRGDTAKHVFE